MRTWQMNRLSQQCDKVPTFTKMTETWSLLFPSYLHTEENVVAAWMLISANLYSMCAPYVPLGTAFRTGKGQNVNKLNPSTMNGASLSEEVIVKEQ